MKLGHGVRASGHDDRELGLGRELVAGARGADVGHEAAGDVERGLGLVVHEWGEGVRLGPGGHHEEAAGVLVIACLAVGVELAGGHSVHTLSVTNGMTGCSMRSDASST